MIRIVCVGKIKEDFFKEAVSEYVKRIGKYSNIAILEIKDFPINTNPSDMEIEQILDKEAEELLTKINIGYNIVLDRQGEMLDSLSLSKKISEIFSRNSSTINFIIGSSYGLSNKVLEKADYKLSFSKLTFPHQLFRVVLLEAIYRSFKIINKETYHK